MHRTLILPLLLALGLSGCTRDTPPPPAKPVVVATDPAILPAHQRELTGNLLGAPAGSEVELALMTVDQRGRPHRLLASVRLSGDGEPLPFRLKFNADSFPANVPVQLHGRATQAGQLIRTLPAVPVTQADSQALGTLQLVRAP